MATLETLERMLMDIADEVAKVALKTDRINAKAINAPGGLSDISTSLGVVSSGELRQGNGLAIGSGFSGVRVVYPAVNYGGTTYNVCGVDSDTLQFGIRSSDGMAVFGQGLVELNDDGINITQGSAAANRLSWQDSSNIDQGWIYETTGGDSTHAHMYIEVGHDSADYGRAESSLTLRSWVENASNKMEYTAFEIYGKYSAGDVIADLFQYDVDTTTSISIMQVKHDSGVIFNQDGNANIDFTVETDAYNAIFVDASNNSIMLGSNTSAKVGFYGIAAVVQQVLATGAGKTVDEVITFLQTIGLCKQS